MLENEQKLTLTEASKKAPGRPHASTMWRLCRKGVKAANGERIYLEHIRFGSKIYTSAPAIERLAARVAQADMEHFGASADEPTPPVPTTRTDQQCAQAIAAAERETVDI